MRHSSGDALETQELDTRELETWEGEGGATTSRVLDPQGKTGGRAGPCRAGYHPAKDWTHIECAGDWNGGVSSPHRKVAAPLQYSRIKTA